MNGPARTETNEELRRTIHRYENGVGRRFFTCLILVVIGLFICALLGDRTSPQGWAAYAVGFIVACCSTIPAARNMILRDHAQDARATLQQRARDQNE